MADLIVTEGPEAGKRFSVDSEVVLGRGEVDLVVEDSEVSRRHARLRPTAEGLEVEDLGSTNGTHVNGARVTGPTALKLGDSITVGTTTIRLEPRPGAADTVVAPVVAEEGADEERAPTAELPSKIIGGPGAPRSRRWIAIGVVVAIVVAAVGIYLLLRDGTSREEFVQAGRDICATAGRRADRVGLSLGSQGSELRRDLGRVRAIRSDALGLIEMLERPEAQSKTVRNFTSAFQKTNRAIRRVERAAGGKQKAVARARRGLRAAAGKEQGTARRLGLRQCAGLGLP
jgi:hypothetical protein